MPAATLQLLYTGLQDMFLTTDPEITFFKTVYKRHTNFSIDTIREHFDGDVDFDKTIRCKLSKYGDLLHKICVYVELSKFHFQPTLNKCNNCRCTCNKCIQMKYDDIIYGWANAIGHVLLETIDISIGGNIIDRHYGEWLEIWTELNQSQEKKYGYYEMIGKVDMHSYSVDTFTDKMSLYIPLNFWFCRKIGLSLPVMNIIYQDVEIIIKLAPLKKCYVTNKKNAPIPKAEIYAELITDYIFLSLDERQRFYNESHVYLIDQLQLNTNNVDVNKLDIRIDLCFNNPVKDLVWLVQRQDVIGPPDGVWPDDGSYPKGNDHFNFTPVRIPRHNRRESFHRAKLQLSGIDRTAVWPASHFRLLRPYYYNNRVPSNNIYVYPFGLPSTDDNPSGSCNMCSDAKLCFRMNKISHQTSIRIYATTYQILLLSGGMVSTMFF